MQHLTEQELVLHHYHDDESPAAIAQHLQSCDACRAEYNAIQRVLALVNELPVPERGEGYGELVWTRLRWKLGSEGRRRRTWQSMLAAAAVLAVAFFAGELWQARSGGQRPSAVLSPSGQPRVASLHETAKDRVLLVVVTDHLDSSERMLLEVANADATRGLDLSNERERAEELVSTNRIYRQTATQRGDDRLAMVLSDLEPVLIEIAHADGKLSPEEATALQKRIDSKGLLFKVRVISAQTSGQEKRVAPQKGITSL
jgi:hypothetical protein